MGEKGCCVNHLISESIKQDGTVLMRLFCRDLSAIHDIAHVI